MCLGVPGKVMEIADADGLRMARVDFGGIRKDVCLAYTPETQVGDYVIVHVGFAISRLDEDEARRTFAVLREMGDLLQMELDPASQLLDPDGSAPPPAAAVSQS